jgi:hypothetical protein
MEIKELARDVAEIDSSLSLLTMTLSSIFTAIVIRLCNAMGSARVNTFL